jgi:hypothetical protein
MIFSPFPIAQYRGLDIYDRDDGNISWWQKLCKPCRTRHTKVGLIELHGNLIEHAFRGGNLCPGSGVQSMTETSDEGVFSDAKERGLGFSREAYVDNYLMQES